MRLAILLPCLLACAPIGAQAGPHIGYAYPAGGKAGTSFEVTVGGQRLRGLSEAYVSGTGVRAKVKAFDPYMNQRDFNTLREEIGKLQQRRNRARGARRRNRDERQNQPETVTPQTWTAADQKKLEALQRRVADRNRRREIPALADIAVLQVSIAPDTPPGPRDLRLLTAAGLTNALVFCVGELSETRERESARDPDMRIELPVVANGQILPGDVDRFRFRAAKGQRLVAEVAARALIPYLADAVPGWFQATIALQDAAGRELAHVDDYRFHPDPVLVHEIPADGEYVILIRDALYRGREDFVYRIAIGELPFVTSVFPLGGPVDAQTKVELRGVNLESDELALAPQSEPGISQIRVPGDTHAVPFARDTLPESLETEPNQDPASAQVVTLPRILNGSVDHPGDVDVFRFEGRCNEVLVAQVKARCLRSPIDTVLTLTDPTGRVVARSDDHADAAAGLTTHHADSYLRVVLPRSGVYHLSLSDTQHRGGPEFGYRLRVGPPRPDFDLRVLPSCVNARAGDTVELTVQAIRRDGFDGPIRLALRGAPQGFALDGALVPAGQDRVRMTLTVPVEPAHDPIGLHIVGQARVADLEIRRQAVAADDVMQAFLYRHLVPAQEFLVSVRGRGGLPIRPRHVKPVVLPVGGTALLRLPFASRWQHRWVRQNEVRLTLDAPPPGISIRSVTQADSGFEVVLRVDAAKVAAGSAGNLILSASAAPMRSQKDRANPGRRDRRRTLGKLPAIPYRVVKRTRQ